MKKISCIAMLLCSLVAFSSCEKDDDNSKEPVATDVYGNYSGKMNFTKATAPLGTDVTAVVKADTIYFESFPIAELVESIVGKDAAGEIIAAVGKVSYKVGYKAALNAAKDAVEMTLDPKPLVITLPGETPAENIVVNVTISAAAKGIYTAGTKTLKYSLSADAVTVASNPFPFAPIVLNFEMVKK